MLIENEFTAPQPVDALWAFLLDVERIAPCMPGAELTESVDDRTWKGKVSMKFGPIALTFAGTVSMDERDDEAHRVVLSAKGMEKTGKGAATAKVTSWVEPAAEGSIVKMQADITLSGTLAQLSRGLLPEVSKKLTQEFADCLQATMFAGNPAEGPAATSQGPGASATAATPATALPKAETRPLGGMSLGLSAMWALVKNFFRELLGRD